MSEIDLQAIVCRRVVYELAGDVVRDERTYRASDGSLQAMTVYRPAHSSRPLPAVVIVTGYPDAGVKRIFGRHAQDFGSNIAWAELLARSGLIAVTYVNVKPDADAAAVIDGVKDGAGELAIDGDRLGVWACSGNVPNALGVLMGRRTGVRCAALLYGYMLDVDGITAVADNSRFGYVVPPAGRSVQDLPPDLPMFVVRAGRDEMPNINLTIDAFVAHALAANLPVTFANHHAGVHAFDTVDHSAASKAVIEQVLRFFQRQLLAGI